MRHVKPGWRGRFPWPWLGLVAVALALFGSALDAFFVSDDFTLVRAVQRGGPFAVWSGPRSLSPEFFRPLTSLGFYLDRLAFGRRAWGYHVTSVVLHATCAWLVGRIGLVLSGGQRAVAATGALAFVVWPAHGESVAWISGRTDVLATLLGLSSFAAYLQALAATESRAAGRAAALALALFVLGLLAKESLVALPLVVLAHGWLVQARRPRSLRLAASYFAALALFIVARRFAVGGFIGGYGVAIHLNHDRQFLGDNAARLVAHVLGFGVPTYGSRLARLAGLGLGVSLVAVVAALVADRATARAPTLRLLAFVGLALCLSLLPTLNLCIAIAGSEGEHYLYFATAWLALLLALAIGPALDRPSRNGLAVLIVVSGALALVVRVARWKDAGELSRQLLATLAAQPRDPPVVILNLPDDLRDAYVLRNSVWDALADWAPRAPLVYVAGYERLDALDEPVCVERRGAVVTLTLPPGAHGLEYWTMAMTSNAPYSIVEHTPTRMQVQLKSADLRVLAFMHGALVPVP